MDTPIPSCPLCKTDQEDILFMNSLLRVIWVESNDFPGFCRVIANEHVSEIIDLPIEQQQAFMNVVFTVAHTQRVHLNPDKINLASLGNQVPHLHWHVIPRWKTDSHFPNSIWSEKIRDGLVEISTEQKEQLKAQLKTLLAAN
jgi:diadenosine tetraphosphate (Ap4A) HIT family hydrolase